METPTCLRDTRSVFVRRATLSKSRFTLTLRHGECILDPGLQLLRVFCPEVHDACTLVDARSAFNRDRMWRFADANHAAAAEHRRILQRDLTKYAACRSA